MAKGVFTTKVAPGYKDLPEIHYHFPKRYFERVKQTVGDYIVYYEPRRSSVELSSSGGRQAYFGFARVTQIVEDDEGIIETTRPLQHRAAAAESA